LSIRKQRAELEQLEAQISQKSTEHDALAQETAQLWEHIGENSQKTRDIETEIENRNKRLAYLRSEFTKGKTFIKASSGRLRELEARKQRFTTTLAEVEKSLSELDNVQKEQKAQLKVLEKTIEKRTGQRQAAQMEITEA
jgi:chromosome segregation ATPase